jgi:YesN/AraC family two-component response regulator
MSELLKNIHVIFVEDEEIVRNTVSQVLQRRIGSVITAENGQDGLAKILKYNPDIVITDLEMPVMNGIAMIKKIREIYDHNRPIIVITAYKDEEHYTDLADAYLFKPVIIDELEALIIDLVNKYKIGGARNAE